MKRTRKFAKGDTVVTTNNSVWGNAPMTVIVEDDGSGHVTCRHPQLGVGDFPTKTLKMYGAERAKKLHKLTVLKNQVAALEEELFG